MSIRDRLVIGLAIIVLVVCAAFVKRENRRC
jgi:hypothetical protein